MNQTKNCQHCEGQGFTDIRDCTGEIQRQETCLFCGGTGKIEIPTKISSSHPPTNNIRDEID
jgi:DnaJ-class molecular chaperone